MNGIKQIHLNQSYFLNVEMRLFFASCFIGFLISFRRDRRIPYHFDPVKVTKWQIPFEFFVFALIQFMNASKSNDLCGTMMRINRHKDVNERAVLYYSNIRYLKWLRCILLSCDHLRVLREKYAFLLFSYLISL